MEGKNQSYFSVSFELILLGGGLPYDLYVNSSSSKEKFVRIFPLGEMMFEEDLERMKKYNTLYIPEDQRGQYLKSLVKCSNVTDVRKTEVMRDSAIGYLGKIFDSGKEFNTELLGETVDGCRDAVEGMVDVIQEYDIEQVRSLIGSLSFHDFYTFDHSVNVSMYCISILKALTKDVQKEDLIHAGLGGMLHDLGKLKIPTHIINSPNKLTDDEFVQIQKHPEYGRELLSEQVQTQDKDIDLKIISRVIYEHHENFNGTGYPNGLEGEEIHLFARITAIADFFDALTTKRSYHEVMSIQEAVNIMSRAKGKKLDPTLFDAFVISVNHFVQAGKATQEMADDFDPCQPQNVIPIGEVKADVKKASFGGIKVFEDGPKMSDEDDKNLKDALEGDLKKSS
jgi:HD-GYP domain-containing protein (c-di-GMP phosphodiesterase class II)